MCASLRDLAGVVAIVRPDLHEAVGEVGDLDAVQPVEPKDALSATGHRHRLDGVPRGRRRASNEADVTYWGVCPACQVTTVDHATGVA